jgi:chromate transport protein ChrA
VKQMLKKVQLAYMASKAIAWSLLAPVFHGQEGSILTGIVLTIVTIVILATLIPAFWPMLTDSTANIQAINGTDTATVFLKTGWPIAILLVGIGIVVALIYFALKQFGVIGGKGKGKGI